MSSWNRTEHLDISWQHCDRPAYWQGEDVYCSKCQEKLEQENLEEDN